MTETKADKNMPVKEVSRFAKKITFDGKEGYELTVVQQYPKENVDNLVASWEKELKEKREWIENFESHIVSVKKTAVDELNKQKLLIEQSIKNLEKGLKVWDFQKE